jgi:hypothetical protein
MDFGDGSSSEEDAASSASSSPERRLQQNETKPSATEMGAGVNEHADVLENFDRRVLLDAHSYAEVGLKRMAPVASGAARPPKAALACGLAPSATASGGMLLTTFMRVLTEMWETEWYQRASTDHAFVKAIGLRDNLKGARARARKDVEGKAKA